MESSEFSVVVLPTIYAAKNCRINFSGAMGFGLYPAARKISK
jgi:hypothetical protein